MIVFGLTVQWVSAALPREDQTCACTWRTWPKFFDFCRLPPYLKVWRFLEDSLHGSVLYMWASMKFLPSLPFRCRYRFKLTLGKRSLFSNSTNGKKWNLKKFKTKETPFSEDCELQSIERVAFVFIWKESLKEFSDELKYGIVLQRTISDTRRWIVFLFGLCSTLLIHTMNNPPGAEIMTSKWCPGKPKIHESEISLIILMF